MSHNGRPSASCDHSPETTRRDFLKTTAVVGAAAASARLGGTPAPAADNKPAAETTLVKELYESLNDTQRKGICFPFNHELRSAVNNNWHITKLRVGNDFDKNQQELIRQIFMDLHSPEYAEQVFGQVEHDGGFDKGAIALFGTPGNGKFEFVFTGRHVTRRADGDSVEGAAFGGPIFYGHAAESFNEPPDHPGNVYWYQARQANQLFQALDGKQRKLALLNDSRGEDGTDTVKLSGKTTDLAGIPISELSADQRELAEKVMEDVLAPFREADRRESMKLIKKNGLENLHLSYYKNEDIGEDGVWDVWQIEGPAMVWYFRGAPHVHTWVHIRDSA